VERCSHKAAGGRLNRAIREIHAVQIAGPRLSRATATNINPTGQSTDDQSGSPEQSFAARFYQLAAESGSTPALTFGNRTYDYAELGRISNRLAQHLLDIGVKPGDFVTIAVPNGLQFLTTAIACWKIGAIPQPVSARLPGMELKSIVELADSSVVVGVDAEGRQSLPIGFEPGEDLDDSPLPDCVSPSWKAPTSGGSTGRPKLIVSGDPSVYSSTLAGMGALIGAGPGQTMAMPGPLYHNGPFIWTWLTLLAGGHVSLLERFDAEATLQLIDDSKATAIYLVPTMMQRMWKLPDEVKFSFDMSSLARATHLAEPCPPWLKEAWIDWIGAENLYELYGGTEGQMFTLIAGTEWLEHRGSVGKPISGEVKICDEGGNEVGSGQTGDVWMRAVGRDTPTYRYIGSEAETLDGWDCLGDIGWMDADGYLYLSDRRGDMILVGGANIYPAEIEAAINAHPEVHSCAVIGHPDEDKGNLIHAIVQVGADVSKALDEREQLDFLSERLVRYKLPRSVEWTEEPLRDDAGKLRRGTLQKERMGPSSPA
jgi:bile acid-coenzyme A ligase